MHSVNEWILKRIDGMLDMAYGYGREPLYPLLWSIGTVLLFGAFWSTIRIREKESSMDKYSAAREQISGDYPLKPRKWDRVSLEL
jgi:hypothetical protein